MRLDATGRLAFAALNRNKMRSMLTALGIVIGVASVVTMQAMGEGAKGYIGESISGLGSNMLMAMPGASKGGMGRMTLGVPLFTGADIEALRRDAHSLRLVGAANSRPLRLVAGANNHMPLNVAGVSPEYFEVRNWGASEGRLPTYEDERQASLVCTIGTTVRDALFDYQDPIGREIRVQNLTCKVIGVMSTKGATFGQDQDDVVFMPYTTFSRRIIGNDRVAVMFAQAVDADRIDAAKEEMTQVLRRRRHIAPGQDDDFAVTDPREIQALLQTVTGVLAALLAAVAAVSLLVGGIGIMNIMLVSVTERTREIGIRLAVGARRGDILTQFLVEAVVLSAAGGVIGLLLGLLAALGVARGVSLPFVVPASALPLAFFVSVFIGVAFGVIPARKAAAMNPLAALRYE
ncbi:MAG TPA: ABC transporter permease [Myxococcales bacterium]|nr:ABC transporter permease [Myxococcales bacterium]